MEKLTEKLDCSVCMDTLSGRVSMCSYGHSVCQSCSERVERCPTCKNPLTGRNYALEKILEVLPGPCVNTKYGCFVKLPLEELKEHQKSCQFGKVKCWFLKCEVMLLENKILEHVEKIHPWRIYYLDTEGMICFKLNSTNKSFCNFVSYNGKILPYFVNVFVDLGSNELYVGVFTVGPDVEKCEYTLQMYNESDRTPEVTYVLKSKPWPLRQGRQYWTKYAFCVPQKQLQLQLGTEFNVQLAIKLRREEMLQLLAETKTKYQLLAHNIETKSRVKWSYVLQMCIDCHKQVHFDMDVHKRFCPQRTIRCFICYTKLNFNHLENHLNTTHKEYKVRERKLDGFKPKRIAGYVAKNGKVTQGLVFHFNNILNILFIIYDPALYCKQRPYTAHLEAGSVVLDVPIIPTLYPVPLKENRPWTEYPSTLKLDQNSDIYKAATAAGKVSLTIT